MSRSDGLRLQAMPVKYAKRLAADRKDILAYYDYPLSNGPLEVINNKIKSKKHQVHGFIIIEFFKLKIIAIHGVNCALIG
ncbi:MAG: transposase [Thermodesulfobacteriota bacterium]|nr:transposase [Thermodesulfobacteriota bacterium]